MTQKPRDTGRGPVRKEGGERRLWRDSRMLVVLAASLVVAAATVAWQALDSPRFVGNETGQSATHRLLTWYLDARSELLEPVGGDDTPVIFEIEPGESFDAVAERLEAEGLIRDGDALALLARVNGQDTGMQAGRHELNRMMGAAEILVELQTAFEEGDVVTIPEGWRAEEIAAFLETTLELPASELTQLMLDPSMGQELEPVAARPDGTTLEGYLFPDTYEFSPEATPADVVSRFLANFAARFTPEMRAEAEALSLSVHEVVTLASIVEREAVVADERGMIARAFLNRLANEPRLLDADPTIQYALGFQPDVQSWWKQPLTAEDLDLDSPYNTYRTPGLPPGPIANPGLASIQAVLSAPPGDWLYFVVDGEACNGSHRFTASYDEHVANVEAYRASGCTR